MIGFSAAMRRHEEIEQVVDADAVGSAVCGVVFMVLLW